MGRTIGRGSNRDRDDSATVLTNRALVGGLPTESLESILIAETDAPVFQPRIAVVQGPVTTTTPIVTDAPTTVLPPMMKQRDAYDELKILSVVQSYLNSVNTDPDAGPDARNLDTEDDFATMPTNDTTTTTTTLASETTTGAAPTTVKDKSTNAKRKDVQHDDKDDDISIFISNDEYLDVIDQMSSWRSKYFVVLGFFLCFTIKKAQSGNPGNVSPGPGCDTEPLTPQVQGGNFKFDDGSLRR